MSQLRISFSYLKIKQRAGENLNSLGKEIPPSTIFVLVESHFLKVVGYRKIVELSGDLFFFLIFFFSSIYL